MTQDERCDSGAKTEKSPQSEKREDTKKHRDVERVRAVLEEARQRVKPLVKRELEGEVVTGELLNIRLKNACYHRT